MRATLLKAASTVGCLAGIVATWVAMAEILQGVQEKGANSYDKVLLLHHHSCVLYHVVLIHHT
jgi:hypothetical protein